MYGGKNVKILSIAIPCYNSAAYMRRCIVLCFRAGEDVEILIVDDGSTKDNTAEIADEYEKNYPGIVKAIHQEEPADMERQSMPDCVMQLEYTIKWWTAMTG